MKSARHFFFALLGKRVLYVAKKSDERSSLFAVYIFLHLD